MEPKSAATSAVPAESRAGYLDPESRRSLLHRLARIEGHVRALARMVERRECADEILLQTAAVKGALTRFATILVEEELESCFTSCATEDSGDVEDRIERLSGVITTLLKQGR
ncbi:MAG: metal-sensitive transcriptional regulator [Gemmatimonadota bacterium]|nr:metal-sensitive transcriptional regulator [Gemmatimonadota bacterium]